MTRRITWRTYALALVISSLLFLVGLLVGALVTEFKSTSLETELSSLRAGSLASEVLALAEGEALPLVDACRAHRLGAEQHNAQTRAFGRKLDVLETTLGAADVNVRAFKNEYSLMQARDYLFLQKLDRTCGSQTPTALYFYSNAGCPPCQAAGQALEAFATGRNVLVYSFDLDLARENPAVALLADAFAVTSVPTVVLNGEKIEGLITTASLENAAQGA